MRPREEDQHAPALLYRTDFSQVTDHVRGEVIDLQEEVCATRDGFQGVAEAAGPRAGVGVDRCLLSNEAGVQAVNHRSGNTIWVHQ